MKAQISCIARAALGFALGLLAQATWAHGDLIPLRGGLVAWSQELSVELVAAPDNELHLYVDDHGVPVSIADAKGMVNVWRSDGQSSTVGLVPQGTTRLTATNFTLRPDDRIQVIVTFHDGRLIVARISSSAAPQVAADCARPSFAPRLFGAECWRD
jgi:hypothetical protein